MSNKRRIVKAYKEYEGYTIRTTIYQKDTSALCDKEIFVKVYDRPSWPWSWITRTWGAYHRSWNKVASKSSLDKNINDLHDKAENFIDNRLVDEDEIDV